jgi:hypothetical protein
MLKFHDLFTLRLRSLYAGLIYWYLSEDPGEPMAMRSERTQEKSDYHSYLLRLWRESSAGQSERGTSEPADSKEWVWRASLESPQADERRGFANLEELFDFLRQQTSLVSDTRRDSAS